MAIQKQITMSTGNQGNYWRIDHISIDPVTGEARAVLALYKNATKAADAKTAVGAGTGYLADYTMQTISVRYVGGDFPLADTDLTASGKTPLGELYLAVKVETDLDGVDFSTGTDV